MSFNAPIAAPVTITAPSTSTALKAFLTNAPGRVGYRLTNPSSSVSVYVQEVPVGSGAPTAAAVVAAPTAVIPTLGYWDSGARDQTDVYVAVASSTQSVIAQELR